MPQLQQFADRHAAASLKATEEKSHGLRAEPPADALPLSPPVPISVLFNTADGYAYQVTISPFNGDVQVGVCVFTVCRVLLADTDVLSCHIRAAAHCALPFCTVEGGVTWQDVLTTLALAEPRLRVAPGGWNVQVLGLDQRSGGWLPITPALSSTLEARCFLQTNLEVLFEHYRADRLVMQAAPLTPQVAAADWQTPADRRTTPGRAPPPAPVKDYRRVPPRVCLGATPPSQPPHDPTRGKEAATVALPRRLVHDFDAAATPTPATTTTTTTTTTPALPTAWSLVAFLQQQERWAQRCRTLRTRTARLSPDAVLQLVREELQAHRPQPSVTRAVSVDEKGTATWTLSLLECECQLISDCVHDRCSVADAPEMVDDTVLSSCRADLCHMESKARKVCHVVDAVWRAGGRAEEDGAVPADFPTGWLCLLLASLRLRCLRHVAFAYACTGTAIDADAAAAAAWAEDGVHPAATLSSKAALLQASEQAAERLLESLADIDATPADPPLPFTALSETLLTSALSLAELAAYLSMDTAHRCVVLRAVVHVCRFRLCCIIPRPDLDWLPRCVTDIVARMQDKLHGISLTSPAFAAYAELTELLRVAMDEAAEMNAAAVASMDDGTAIEEPPSSMLLGYTMAHLPTTAAVDMAFVRGNTAVREFRLRAAASKSRTPPNAGYAQKDAPNSPP